MTNTNTKTFVVLHLILLVYSFCGVFSKLAGMQPFLSPGFFIFYGAVLLILFVYAILWQQIIKRLPLTTAFANKAIVVIWGILLGMIFFGETITPGKILGAVFIILGIVLYSKADSKELVAHE